MQILLGLLLGAVIGLAAHVVLPGRDLRGAALAPFAGAAAAAAAWTAMTWMGLGDTPLVWGVAVVAPALTVFALIPLISRTRRTRDDEDRSRLPV